MSKVIVLGLQKLCTEQDRSPWKINVILIFQLLWNTFNRSKLIDLN